MCRSAPPFLFFQKRSSCCNLNAEGFFGPGVLLTLCRQSRHMLIKLFCGPSLSVDSWTEFVERTFVVSEIVRLKALTLHGESAMQGINAEVC